MDQIAYYEAKLAFETDAYDLHEARTQGDRVVVIDARSPESYAEEHIAGAINIPHRTMNDSTTGHIDRKVRVVTYCDGIGCNGSTKGALAMTKLGFQTRELLGGLSWWKRDGYPTESQGT